MLLCSALGAAPIPPAGRPVDLRSGDLSGEWLLTDYVAEGFPRPGRYSLTLGARPVEGPDGGALYRRVAARDWPDGGPRPPAGWMLVGGSGLHEWHLDFVYEDRVPVGDGVETVWRRVRHDVTAVNGARVGLVRMTEKGMREVGVLERLR